MKQPVAPTVRAQLINLVPDLFLQQWLENLKCVYKNYNTLFTAEEQKRAFKEHESFLSIPFQKDAIRHIYEKLVDIRDLLITFPHLTHLDLLIKLEPRLAKRYQAVLAQKISPRKQFQELDLPFYELDGSYTTMTKSSTLLESAEIPLQNKLLDAIRAGHNNSPKQALKELNQIIQQKSQQALRDITVHVGDLKLLQKLFLEESRSAFLKELILRNKVLTSQEQKAILVYLTQQERIRDLPIPRFTALTDRFFKSAQWLEYTRHIDIRYCIKLTHKSLMTLSTGAPLLETLNLGTLDPA